MNTEFDIQLKLRFSNEFSSLCKDWKDMPVYVLAEAAAKRKQFAHLPVDMLLYLLEIMNKATLASNVFDFLTYDGCKEYDRYIFEKKAEVLSQIRLCELQNCHIYSLCKFINNKCWKKNRVSDGVQISNLIFSKNSQSFRDEIEYDLKWTLRHTRRDDCKLTPAEIQLLVNFSESLKYTSPDFREAIDIANSKYRCIVAVDNLTVIIKKLFPSIKKDNFDLYEYEEGCLFHYLKWNTTNIGEYINNNYEKGILRLLSAVENGKFTKNETKYAKHFLAAAACVYFETPSSIAHDKKEILYRLFSQNDTFRDILKSYSGFSVEALGEIVFRAFTNLDGRTIATVLDEYLSQHSKDSEINYYFTKGTFSFKFTNCFTDLPLWSENTCEEYFALCKYIDKTLPEMNFKDHQAYKFFQSATEGLKGLLSLQPLFDEMEQGVFWINTGVLPPYIEFDYIYPNGKNGDILKYILEEYGETNIKSGVLWHGKIAKDYIEYFDCFYMSTPLTFISEDPKFLNIFNYHIPTIISNRLKEPEIQQANSFKRFREYMDNTLLYYKDRTKKRTEFYSQLILQGQNSPKWKSEAQLFALVSSIYPDTIYQYRSDWLGSQSLDIFIPSISVGIEYQGVQHYKPIEYFGGEDHFRQQQENDNRKRKLCIQNGVILIEWPYSKKINKENLAECLSTIIAK